MSGCDLQIELESETVRPGQPVRGAIRVLIDQECSCSGLEVGFVLVGAGTRNDQSETVTLFQGTWSPGEHRYAFELKAPAHPLEYIGKTVCYSWVVEARARIPWSDAVASTPIRLVAPAGMGLRVTMDSPGDPSKVVSDEAQPGASDVKGYAIAALLAVGAVGAIVAGLLLGAWEPVAAGAFFLVIVTVGLVAHAKGRPAENAAARRRVLFGRPQLAAYQKDGPSVPGSQQASQGFECTVWLKPDAPPAQVKVSLQVLEITLVPETVRGHGRGRRGLVPFHRAAPVCRARGAHLDPPGRRNAWARRDRRPFHRSDGAVASSSPRLSPASSTTGAAMPHEAPTRHSSSSR